jgi:magnesium transporter
MSNRMNEIVKVLTLISTIFIPLTFIAGVYGMNFRVIPGLEWRFGYYLIMALMFVIAGMMLFYFKKKKWF